MSVYYRDDLVTLYHADCLEERAWLAGDVLITDPPYGMGYVSNFSRYGSTDPVANDHDPAARDAALELWGDRPALVFGTWKQQRPAATRQLLVWDKGNTPSLGDLSMPWGPAHEECYVLGHGWTGRRTSNVIRADKYSAGDARRPDHPTPKPVGLMEHLVERAPPGVIVDPFAGSGATLKAARNLGRTVIGVEIEERYCELIAKALDQQTFDFGDTA